MLKGRCNGSYICIFLKLRSILQQNKRKEKKRSECFDDMDSIKLQRKARTQLPLLSAATQHHMINQLEIPLTFLNSILFVVRPSQTNFRKLIDTLFQEAVKQYYNHGEHKTI